MILCLLASPAFGACGPHAEVEALLAGQYHETPRVLGLTAQGALFELLASPDGTWTVLIVNADGVACVAAVGDNFEVREAIAPGRLN